MTRIFRSFCITLGAAITVTACTSQDKKKKSEAKSATKLKKSVSGPVGWVAWGDLRGNIEPCGCDIKINYGGYKRIHSFVSKSRKKHPQLWAFSLGNTLADTEEVKGASTSGPFLLEALAATQPDAVLFNKIEMEKAYSIEKTLLERKLSVPYVLTNFKGKKPPNALVKRVRRDKSKNLIIYGYTWGSQYKNSLEAVDSKLLSRWKKHLEQYKGYEKVLLFSGPKPHLQKFMDAELFRTVIASNNRKFGELANAEDVKNTSDITNKFSRARVVMEVPLGGQGVIAGGVVADPYRPKKSSPAKELFGSPAKKHDPFAPSSGFTPKKSAPSFSFEDLSPTPVWLPPEMEDKKALADLFKRYNAAQASNFTATLPKRLKSYANTPYIGSKSCQTCHPAEYKKWKKTQHAHAYKTLQDAGKHQDVSCVGCHVVNFEKPGGFVSLEKSPELANVTCETCHGPRKAHTKNPAITKKHKFAMGVNSGPEVCASCHVPAHSPNFDYKKYWERIKH